MSKHSIVAARAALVAGLVFASISFAAAATPSSSLSALPSKTNTRSVSLSYTTSGSGGTVDKVDLYAKKDNGAFVLVATSYSPNTPFIVDFGTLGGDGRYAFHTKAYLTGDPAGEAGKDTLEETVTYVDTVAPPAPDAGHIFVNQAAASLQTNEISGYDKAVEGNATVEIYSDSGLTTKIASLSSTAKGAFGPIDIGSTTARPYVWVVAMDDNGNRSVATLIKNSRSYTSSVSNLVVTPISGTTLHVTYSAATEASEYIVYYRHSGGSVWSAQVRTKDTVLDLTGLEAGRAYDVRVAPVSSDNNVGGYTFASIRTTGTPLHDVVLASEKKVSTTTATATKTTVAKSATTKVTTTAKTTPAATTSTDTATKVDTSKTDTSAKAADTTAKPADTTTPAAADAAKTDTPADQSKTDDQNQPSSATPWVILAILIILAGIATGGYFYWFSGPEEVTTTVTEATKSDKKKDDSKDEEDKRW